MTVNAERRCALPGCYVVIEAEPDGRPRRKYCTPAHRAVARQARREGANRSAYAPPLLPPEPPLVPPPRGDPARRRRPRAEATRSISAAVRDLVTSPGRRVPTAPRRPSGAPDRGAQASTSEDTFDLGRQDVGNSTPRMPGPGHPEVPKRPDVLAAPRAAPPADPMISRYAGGDSDSRDRYRPGSRQSRQSRHSGDRYRSGSRLSSSSSYFNGSSSDSEND